MMFDFFQKFPDLQKWKSDPYEKRAFSLKTGDSKLFQTIICSVEGVQTGNSRHVTIVPAREKNSEVQGKVKNKDVKGGNS